MHWPEKSGDKSLFQFCHLACVIWPVCLQSAFKIPHGNFTSLHLVFQNGSSQLLHLLPKSSAFSLFYLPVCNIVSSLLSKTEVSASAKVIWRYFYLSFLFLQGLAQAHLKLSIFLLQPPECWNYSAGIKGKGYHSNEAVSKEEKPTITIRKY